MIKSKLRPCNRETYFRDLCVELVYAQIQYICVSLAWPLFDREDDQALKVTVE